MSEREWQPGASDAAGGTGRSEGGAAGDARTDDAGARGRGATDDVNNVEGVQGAQGGRVDGVERERPEGGAGRERVEERGEVF